MATVDTDLEEMMSHLGEFGKYQFRQYTLHVLAGLTAGIHMLTLLTVAATPEHKCMLPGLDKSLSFANMPNFSYDGNFDIKSDEKQCNYFKINKDQNISGACQEWVYDDTYYKSSRGIEGDFVCDNKWKGAVAQSSYMLGVFFGAVTLGSLADKYGRKIIFCISGTAQMILGVLVAFVSNYWLWLIVRFLYGIFGSAGAYITGFVLTMEMVGPSKRTVCGMMFQMAFAFGFIIVAFWGAMIKDPMWLQVIYGLHGALLIPHWWLMNESPRWLWAQGRGKEAVQIVQRALKINGENIQLDTANYVSKNQAKQASRESSGTYGAMDLLKTPNLRKKFLNVCLNWFANAITYYGLTLSSGKMGGNPYLSLTLSALVEVPSYIFASFTMDKLGRRFLVSLFMLIGGICCIIAALLPMSGTFSLIIVLVGKACIALSFAVIYNYTAELFPTVLRNTALGIGSMCCRLAGASAPLLLLMDSLEKWIPATTFGVIALVSGFLSLFLPETAGQPMPESLEDGEKFGQGDTFFTTFLGDRTKDDYSHDVMLKTVTDADKTSDTDVKLTNSMA